MKSALSILLVIACVGSLSAQSSIRVYQPSQPYLGLIGRDVNLQEAQRFQLSSEIGVYVEEVQDGGPAADAELQRGDIILEYAGIPVLSLTHLSRLVSETPIHRRIELTIFRDGQRITRSAQVGQTTSAIDGGTKRPGAALWDWPDPQVLQPPLEQGRHFFFFSGRPRLGITGADLTEQLSEYLGVPGKRGVLVAEVFEGTPAARAGLRAGDVIVSVDGAAVKTLHELSSRLSARRHQLEIIRDRQPRQVIVESLE